MILTLMLTENTSHLAPMMVRLLQFPHLFTFSCVAYLHLIRVLHLIHFTLHPVAGKVVVHHLYSNETAEYEYNGPIGSVALEPTYPKSDKRELVCGGKTEKLVLNTKGWFGRKNVVLHAGEGPIHAVKWRGSLIAWANNLGVKVYDCNTEERIAYIDRTKYVSPFAVGLTIQRTCSHSSTPPVTTETHQGPTCTGAPSPGRTIPILLLAGETL